METIFDHKPTEAELNELGVPATVAGLLAIYTSQNSNFMLIAELYELRGQADKAQEYTEKRGESAQPEHDFDLV